MIPTLQLGGMGRRFVEAAGGPATALYWRVHITASGDPGLVFLAEVEMRGAIGSADQCTGGTASADSTFDGVRAAANAFDNDLATNWGSANTAFPHWIQYQFPSATGVAQIAITSTASFNASYAPKDFTLQYSSDNVAFTTVLTVTGQTGWGANETRLFNVP